MNGYDFANNDTSVYDRDPISGADDEHGTHVAGTIVAEGNNGIGVAGATWRAKIMVLKFLGPNDGYTSDAIEALNYAVAEGAKISNNSWGGVGYNQALLDAINRADAAGHLFVTAAGNGGADGVGDDTTPHYPSNYNSSNIISVAATDSRDAFAPFSNYGSNTVDLTAPGVGIMSTLPGNAYGRFGGTSMATPHVSGLDDAQLKDRILRSVDRGASMQGMVASGGRANAAQALGVQTPPPPPPQPSPSPSPPPSIAPPSSPSTALSPKAKKKGSKKKGKKAGTEGRQGHEHHPLLCPAYSRADVAPSLVERAGNAAPLW